MSIRAMLVINAAGCEAWLQMVVLIVSFLCNVCGFGYYKDFFKVCYYTVYKIDYFTVLKLMESFYFYGKMTILSPKVNRKTNIS